MKVQLFFKSVQYHKRLYIYEADYLELCKGDIGAVSGAAGAAAPLLRSPPGSADYVIGAASRDFFKVPESHKYPCLLFPLMLSGTSPLLPSLYPSPPPMTAAAPASLEVQGDQSCS